MDSPSLRQLDLFAQMMAAGSAARCADDLGVGVGQILAEIAALEMRLGYRLFDDPAGAARLTAAGRKTAQAMMLLGQDSPAPETAEAAPAASSPLTEPARQALVLAAPAPVFGHLQDALAAFEAANEDIAITLDLHVHSARDAAAALAAGRADIVYFYALEEPPDLPSRYGWSEPLNLYAGSAHPLARAETVNREALAITPALALEPSGGLWQVTDAALARGRASLGPVLLESDDMAAIVAALRAGVGCFPAFGPLARDLGRMPGVSRLALDMPLPGIEVRQAIGLQAKQKVAVEALADFLFL